MSLSPNSNPRPLETAEATGRTNVSGPAVASNGNNMTFTFLGFTDVNGVIRGKSYAKAAFDRVCERPYVASPDIILAIDPLDAAITTLENIGIAAGSRDVRLIPDRSTVRAVPWRGDSQLCLGDLAWTDGSPCELSARQVLRSALGHLEQLGLQVMSAFEYELRLWRIDDGLPATGPQCYSAAGVDEIADFCDRLLAASEAMGLGLSAIHTEGGAGLVEVNIDPADGLLAADNATLLRYAVHATARQSGFEASFLAKPVVGEEGSSGHVHISLWKAGTNVMTTDDPTRPNATMSHAIGGILRHLPAMSVILNPNINSYKRLIPGFFAPTTVTWGVDNRSTSVRAVAIDDPNARIEIRRPGADTNPYLVLAALAVAISEGISQAIEPPPPVKGDVSAHGDERCPPLPGSLESAVIEFRKDPRFAALLGPDFCEYFALTREWELKQWQNAVSDWERARYRHIT